MNIDFNLIFDNFTDGVRLTDANGTIIKVNNSFCKIMRKSKKELENKSISILYLDSEETQLLEKYIARFELRQIDSKYENKLILWNGDKITFEITNSFIEEEEPLVLSIFHPIILEEKSNLTELTKLINQEEAKLFRNWSLFDNFMEGGDVVGFIKDNDGYFIWYNDNYADAFHLSPKEFQIGKNDFECWDHDTAIQLREHDLEIFKNDSPVMLLEKVPTPNREQNWLVYKFPFMDTKNGKCIGGFAIKIPESFYQNYIEKRIKNV